MKALDKLLRPTAALSDDRSRAQAHGAAYLWISKHFYIMKCFLPLCLMLILCGCIGTVTKSGLDAKAAQHAGNSFPDQTYYVGSDGGYDYFVIRSGMGGSLQRFRVLESEGAVTNRFTATEEQARWRGYGITGIVVTNPGQIVIPK